MPTRPAARCDTVVFYGAAAYTANAARLRRQRLHQHADHRRCAGQRLLRLHGHRRRTRPGSSAASPASTPTASAAGSRPRPRPATSAIAKVAMNSAPALSSDAQHAVRRRQQRPRRRLGAGRLPARARQHDARHQGPGAAARPGYRHARAHQRRRDRRRRRSAPTATSSSASWRRTFGAHNARGWLLHFDATLATQQGAGRLRLGQHGVGRAGGDGAVVRRHARATC